MHSFERKPRILFVGAFPPEERGIYGGIVSSCRTLLKSTLSQDVDFLLLDSTQKINPPPRFIIRLGQSTKRFLQFIARIVGERPDATLIFLSAGASVVEKGMMAWVAKAFGVRVLLFPRAGRVIDSASRSRFIRVATRFLLRPADVLLCQSNTWQRFACAELKVPVERTLVIENWTASSELLEVGLRRPEIAPRTGPLQATFVGWVESNKGIFELLEAFSKVSYFAGVHLRIVGDGRARAAAEINAQRLGIADRVHFLGWLSSVPLRAVLEHSDLFILPSWAEGLPNAMIEAMAARLPVIVTNVGGIPDVIEDRVTGFLVEPQSSENLAAVIQEVLNRDDIGRAVADAGFDVAIDRFSVAKAVQKFRVGFKMALRSPV